MAEQTAGSIILVHGTGVRLTRYRAAYQAAKMTAASCGLPHEIIPCAWGDALGVEFEGRSLPDGPSREAREQADQDEAHWNWLLGDPFFELVLLTIPNERRREPDSPSQVPPWELLWKRISSYQATPELKLLLERSGLWNLWPVVWSEVTEADVTRAAFQASSGALPEASRAMARCLVAQLHATAVGSDLSGPDVKRREKLVERLLEDWNQQVLGISDFFIGLIQRSGTTFIRNRRSLIQESATSIVGDILLYQARGEAVRAFIRGKIAEAVQPVTLVGHSLGGVACVDLLGLPNPPKVANLVTMGSQSSFFNEIGALLSLKSGERLPDTFPAWLNVFDRNDFLSFVCKEVFPQVSDFEARSGQPFPDSHSAYFSSEAVWTAIRSFVSRQPR